MHTVYTVANGDVREYQSCSCDNKLHGSGCSIKVDSSGEHCIWCKKGCLKRKLKNNP